MTLPHRQEPIDEVLGRRFAVILVDVQNDFCHPDGVFSRAGLELNSRDQLVRSVNKLVRAARAGGQPVVWTTMVWDNNEQVGLLGSRSPFLARAGLRRGTWGAELMDGLEVAQGDRIVEKTRFSSFFRTDLEDFLQRGGIEYLIVAGVRTDFCVESTVRDAFFRDLHVFLPVEAVRGYVPELHENSLRVMGTVFARLVSVDDAVRVLRATRDPS